MKIGPAASRGATLCNGICNMTTIKMNAGERAEFRKAVTAHGAWKNYRKTHGLNSAAMSQEQWIEAGRALGIDAASFVGNYQPKPRTADYYAVAKVTVLPLAMKLSEADRSFVARIADDADRHAGMITDGQADALRKIAARYADETPAPAPMPEAPAETPAPAPVPAPAVPGDAASQLAALIASLAGSQKLDEARVIELIKAHGGSPAHVTIDLRTPAMPEGVPGERVMHYREPLLLAAVNARVPVMLVGPAGSGKTTAARNVADALGLPFYFTGAIDSPYKLLGFIDAQGRTVRTPFREAFEHGGVFLFDEQDASLPGAVLAFNAATANGVCDFPDATVKAHENFRVIAACNTFGRGADRQYVGRLQQDAAALDRYAVLTWDYDPALESAMIGLPRPEGAPVPASVSPLHDDAIRTLAARWLERVRTVRAKVEENKIRHVVSPRATILGTRLLAAGWPWADAEEAVIFKGVDSDARAKIQ